MQSRLTLASALALASTVYAQTVHEVSTVAGQLAFEPNTLENVAEGDMIRVTFAAQQSHNIIAGSYESACAYNSDIGMHSGSHQDGEVWIFQVNSTDPEIYFCSVGSHCQAGMALAINPSGENTIDAYQSASSNARTVQPESREPAGGMLETGEMMSSMTSSASDMETSTSMNGMSTATSSGSMPAATSSDPTSTSSEDMTSATSSGATPAATTTGASAASGLQSNIAMVAALVAGVVAFLS